MNLMWILLLLNIGVSHGIEVVMETKDSGFFLKSPNEQIELQSSSRMDKFTIFYPYKPVTVRAHYGPFSVRQSVEPTVNTANIAALNRSEDEEGDFYKEAVNDPDFFNLQENVEVNAHLVTPEVMQDNPIIRVLFHVGHGVDMKARKRLADDRHTLCANIYVHNQDTWLVGSCNPNANQDGVCLVEVLLPSSWWPLLDDVPTKAAKIQKTKIRVEYSVLWAEAAKCIPSTLHVSGPPTLNAVFLGNAMLSSSHSRYEDIKNDGLVKILVPQRTVYPKAKVYVPVYIRNNNSNVNIILMRTRVKNGLRITGIHTYDSSCCQISADLNNKHTLGSVYIILKNTSNSIFSGRETLSGFQEAFTWLFEVDEDANFHDSGKIIWQMRYLTESAKMDQYEFSDENSAKLTSQLNIHKDDVQYVLPLAKTTQLLNTAVLNGHQVSQSMKVFVVSQAGLVGDVTLQSSCHSTDESILKVSPSCTSVYLDGSEIRGSQNASVLVKYGTYTGQVNFFVWMPELPLEVHLSDTKLSQIKSWRTPHMKRKHRHHSSWPSYSGSNYATNKVVNGMQNDQAASNERDETIVCRLRYQQAKIDVFTRFFSMDHNSGREAYLLNRRSYFRITELVSPFLRVADSWIASLHSTIVQGKQSGRTEVQVLSPITGRVIGAREFRVGNDKETITEMMISVVSGLQLSVIPDSRASNVFVARTAISNKLTAQYQEGLLNIALQFSDGTTTSLSEVDDADYQLSMDSFDSSIVAFAPMNGLGNLRVIALGEGEGNLLHVALELTDQCQRRRSQPLAMAYAHVKVEFSAGQTPSIQNDARLKLVDGMSRNALQPKNNNLQLNTPGLQQSDIESILFQDAIKSGGGYHYYQPTIQARQHSLLGHTHLSPLEIGMYALLGIFCVAIMVFVMSCTVFAVKYHRKQLPSNTPSETVSHAQDWVWLGRTTLERNSVNTKCSESLAAPDANDNNQNAADNNKNTTITKPVSKKYLGNSTVYPTPEISIHITTNPHQLDEDFEKHLTLIENGRMKKTPSLVDLQLANNSIKKVVITSNPTYTKHPPPVPPHRDMSPPIPPRKRVSVPTETDNSPKSQATSSSLESINSGLKVSSTDGIKYEQLMEYFENLKESSA